MPREHSSYRGVMIYDGSVGEKPMPGAFYQTTANEILAGAKATSIGFKAYGQDKLWRLINDHPWNLQNVRRYGANNCSQPLPLGSKQGNIIICKRDGKYPILWIPPLSGEGPDEIKPARPPVGPDITVVPAGRGIGEEILVGGGRSAPFQPPSSRGSTAKDPGTPGTSADEQRRQQIIEQNKQAAAILIQQQQELARRAQQSKKSTMVWLVGIGLLAMGIVVATKVRKRRR